MSVMVDPPSGWQYGFPKEAPPNHHLMNQEEFNQWLIDSGYPERLIIKLGNSFYVRMWEAEEQ